MAKWQGGGVTVAMVGSMSDVKGNPTMATAKQLAWRKKFAAMAKAGAFTKRKRSRNPLTRVRVNSPSMATGDAPSKRLIKRRKKTAKAPAGYYANPRKPAGVCVEAIKGRGSRFVRIATFPRGTVGAGMARVYARALHNAHPGWTIRVASM